ncbi:uncharacterized protein LOC143785059 isoform X2 [Ranitomeya variabilis]|uniref:uncharacterized protein LOC143785059 isoform X2 n=1 Tax=Ranitomeya variabilis TaxID=490064 RepID=UPI0040579352
MYQIKMEQDTLKKFEKIKDTMEGLMESGTDCTESNKPHKVGIIADFLAENTFGWFHAALSSHYFSKIIKKIEFIDTSDMDTKKILKTLSSCTFYIYMKSGYNRETFPAITRRLGFLIGRTPQQIREDPDGSESGTKDRKHLIIIIYNVEDNSEREKERILRENGNWVQYWNKVFLFSKVELQTNFLSRLVNDHQPGSMRKKKKGTQSMGRKSARNLFSSDDRQQEPEVIKHDNGKGKQNMSATLPVYRKETRQVRGSEKKSVFNFIRTQSMGRKLISSDHHHQEPQNTRYRDTTESVTIDRDRQQKWKMQNPDTKGDAGEHFSQVMKRHRVGIFSRSSDSDYSWLVQVLRSEDFRPHISLVQNFRISKDTVREFIQEVRKCTFGILYQTQKMERSTVTTIQNDLQLETLCSMLGKQNVAIVIDDVEDSSNREKFHILGAHPWAPERAGNLLLVSYRDKMEKKQLEKVKMELIMQLQGSDLIKYDQRMNDVPRTFPTSGTGHGHLSPQGTVIQRHWVGIFSRSTDRDYPWLVEILKSEEFSSLVANVKSCSIYNSQRFQDFIDDINQSTVGILYHSKRRGRVNVTDVNDSLYDQELQTLHMLLGKRNVLVIIDDLEDSGDYRKKGILHEQRSIAQWAADLLLVSHDDKMDSRLLRKIIDQLKAFLRGAGSVVSSGV